MWSFSHRWLFGKQIDWSSGSVELLFLVWLRMMFSCINSDFLCDFGGPIVKRNKLKKLRLLGVLNRFGTHSGLRKIPMYVIVKDSNELVISKWLICRLQGLSFMRLLRLLPELSTIRGFWENSFFFKKAHFWGAFGRILWIVSWKLVLPDLFVSGNFLKNRADIFKSSQKFANDVGLKAWGIKVQHIENVRQLYSFGKDLLEWGLQRGTLEIFFHF